MQAISVSEARTNIKKYCDDVTKKNDTIIVSKNGNGMNNMV
ncbi:MAG: type II toxin-antitoxin system Phd/YefM family antitoxin [Clostridia bacterium]|nr:type II toxin-antitoxin system Phd/YefM family antitoxin [Clostridia bacterium]